jgi:hypothetical protein
MSNALVNAVRDLLMPSSPKAVLAWLADAAKDPDHPTDAGACWPRLETLMRWTCLSRSAVISALDVLEVRGLVTRLHTGRATRYQLADELLKSARNTSEVRQAYPDPSGSPIRSSGAPGTSCRHTSEVSQEDFAAVRSGSSTSASPAEAGEQAGAGALSSPPARTVHAATRPYAQRSAPADEAESRRWRQTTEQEQRLQNEVIHRLAARGESPEQIAASLPGMTAAQVEGIAKCVGIVTALTANMNPTGGSAQ